ncbi:MULTISPECIES: outer membrane protein [Legionella]|uniref:Outer membrane beta-barrel protein n=1 Tax=Legionella resiliens TaxID=2905958 RepID=A0ABS8X1Y5_9GAMM|nr:MULTISPECIES: outer membrane beta-barrel protein [unclassified Legionella]MCE0722136.1 outer membrane beta-barrel protein [Legionella sp. 9fVS26]MCE3531290.1 outer membrane beta-barrel protein [Legionella sp. 8cVS16]QLZ67302.1 hypothetical protein FOLKNPGA_00067 [Legionella sp. PC1000]
MNFIKFSLIVCMVGVGSCPTAAPVPVAGWTGFYAGINGGYANTHNEAHARLSTVRTLPSAASTSALAAATSVTAGTSSFSSNKDSFIGGGQIGYLYSFNQFVLGVEADIQGITPGTEAVAAQQVVAIPTFRTSRIASNLSLTQSIDYLGTVRARIGVLATPSLLFAATGGYAYGGIRSDTDLTQSYLGTANNLVRTFTSNGSSSSIQNGWTVGGTLEWRFQGQWSTKLEYLYYDLDSLKYRSTPLTSLINGGPDAGNPLFVNAVSTTSRFNGQIARLGINYLFA